MADKIKYEEIDGVKFCRDTDPETGITILWLYHPLFDSPDTEGEMELKIIPFPEKEL